MASTETGAAARARNVLLADLPADEWERIRPNAEIITLQARQILYERNGPIDHVYFPTRGCISLVITFSDGFQAEAGLVGFEGMVGLPVLQDRGTDVAEAMVQVPSEALRVRAGAFVAELARMPTLDRSLRRYSGAMNAQAMQIAACNGHHGLEPRLARCLLLMLDRGRGDELRITQEVLAMLLCAHRPSVSVAAGRLQRRGLIRYTSGQLVVMDRAGLELVSCECYQIIRDRFRSPRYRYEAPGSRSAPRSGRVT